ncbi:MAG: DNA replication/repair protein RecF [Flavitalea sp.]
MLKLNSISLYQFKNYPFRNFVFSEKVIGIHGLNGRGKTNLLDAIYYSCFTKGYFNRSDAQNVLNGAQGFRIEATFDLNSQSHQVVSVLRENGKKEISVDGELYDRLSSHIGKFPCVFIAPDDIYIITEASEERRRLIDAILSQTDLRYLYALIDYNKVLQQRNSYLKSLEGRRVDGGLLDVYDQQLVTAGNYIYSCRKEFLAEFIPTVNKFYVQIAGSEEGVDLVYKSQLNDSSLQDLLVSTREKDMILQRTSAGTHRDDLEFFLGDKPFKSQASQGQRKSLLFSLKLAEFEMLKKNKGFSPIIMLDDVFEKLDAERMHNLLDHICSREDVQLFLTDTHGERIKTQMEKIGVNCQLIEITG